MIKFTLLTAVNSSCSILLTIVKFTLLIAVNFEYVYIWFARVSYSAWWEDARAENIRSIGTDGARDRAWSYFWLHFFMFTLRLQIVYRKWYIFPPRSDKLIDVPGRRREPQRERRIKEYVRWQHKGESRWQWTPESTNKRRRRESLRERREPWKIHTA